MSNFNYTPLAKPNKSQAMNKAKIKLIELRTIAKIASFRWGELSDLTARKIPTGKKKKGIKNPNSPIVTKHIIETIERLMINE
jgi:hypothetical protein